MALTIETEEPDDIRATLLASVAEVEEKTPGSTGDLTSVAPKPSVEVKAPTEAKPETQPGQAPAKDPVTGKFQAKDKSGVEVEKPAEQKPQESAKSAIPGTEVDKTLAAPAQWKAEAKAAYEKLPPEIRKVISGELSRRETEFSQGFEAKVNELKQIKGQFDEIEPHLTPRRAALTANYGSVGAAMKRLFDLSDFAGSDPKGFIAWFSQQTGTDLQSLMQSQAAAPQVAPEVAQLQQTLSGLQNELKQLKGNTEQTHIRSAASEFDALENEADTGGAKVRPFWSDLRTAGLLAPEITLVRQEHPEWSATQVGKEAYDRVVWKHSDTRNQLLSQREASAEAEREAKARGAAAKNAQKSITGSPPGNYTPPTGAPNDDIRAEIASNYAAATSGATRL